ncbi:MAG: TetR/AcrR family transcriptional regulator [Dongiaceae bacterium]
MAVSAKASTGRTGRPSRGEGVGRRHRLLSAALDVFLRQGFSGTSLDDIARSAHVAKRTIYQQFRDKEGLFAAAVERSATSLISRFPTGDQASGEIGADLGSVGCAVLRFVLQPRSLAIYRLVTGEAERQPRLAQMFYEHGPGRAVASVAELLMNNLRPERIAERDAVALARRFIGIAVLEIHQRAVLGTLPALSAKEIEEHAAAATQAFLATLQTPSRHGRSLTRTHRRNR